MTDQVIYPIIYVRGFAGGTSGIDNAADDPFYGFNAGATHVRVDGDGNPQFYQFEGPLVRLMEDEDYRVVVHGGQQAYLRERRERHTAAKSIWIYRFYDIRGGHIRLGSHSLQPSDRGERPAHIHRSGPEKTGAAKGLAGRTFDGRSDLPQHDPEGMPGCWPPCGRCRRQALHLRHTAQRHRVRCRRHEHPGARDSPRGGGDLQPRCHVRLPDPR